MRNSFPAARRWCFSEDRPSIIRLNVILPAPSGTYVFPCCPQCCLHCCSILPPKKDRVGSWFPPPSLPISNSVFIEKVVNQTRWLFRQHKKRPEHTRMRVRPLFYGSWNSLRKLWGRPVAGDVFETAAFPRQVFRHPAKLGKTEGGGEEVKKKTLDGSVHLSGQWRLNIASSRENVSGNRLNYSEVGVGDNLCGTANPTRYSQRFLVQKTPRQSPAQWLVARGVGRRSFEAFAWDAWVPWNSLFSQLENRSVEGKLTW